MNALSGRQDGPRDWDIATSVSEELSAIEVEASATTIPAPRVLFLAANPSEEAKLRLDREFREVKEAFQRTNVDFKIEHQPALRTLDLARALHEFQPNLVHFGGHGTGPSGLVIEDDQGEAFLVHADGLARLFQRFSDTVACVVLNACYSAEQAQAIARHVRHVIGMESAIPDRAAINFAVAFYDQIAAQADVGSAFLSARAVLGLDLGDSPPMAVLHTRRRSGGTGTIERMDPRPRTDWREAPRVTKLYGRDDELGTLRKWILKDHCSLILVVGIGGVGKSRLSVKLGRGGVGKTNLSRECAGAVADHFEFVMWKRLLNAPPPSQIVTECIRFILGDGDYTLPSSFEGRISALLALLQDHRCLLVLDNIEAVLEGGQDAIRYRVGFEGYGEFLRTVGETEHHSCILLTSREKPPEVARMEGPARPVRTLPLGGLSTEYGRQVVGDLGSFDASDQEWDDLVELYDGNPLALELAAHHIRDAHFGNVRAFLGADQPIFGDLRDLLDWHLARLSAKEREVMYWLAIEREAVSIPQLQDDLLSPTSRGELPTTIQSLQRRLPIERHGPAFSLQPVLMEYMTESLVKLVGEEVQVTDSRVLNHFTEKLIDEVVAEVAENRFDLFNAHALLKADAKDHVRVSQSRVIVQPLVERLLAQYGHPEAVEAVLFSIVEVWRRERPLQPGYAIGNLLDLFCELGTDLTGANLSRCVVWQAYLQTVELHDVDFTSCRFRHVKFRGDFAQLLCVACSADGSLMAAGDTLNVLRVWSLPELKSVSSCLGHYGWIGSVAFSSSGDLMASGGFDHTVRLWDPTSGECLGVLEGHSNWVTSLVVSPRGDLLASSGEDGEVRLWNIRTMELLRTLVRLDEGRIGAVAFDPEGRWVASVDSLGTLRLTELDGFAEVGILQLEGSFRSLKFMPDGQQLALGGDAGQIVIVSVPTLAVRRRVEAHAGGVWSIAVSSDGRWLASTGNDGLIHLWHASSGEFVRSFQGHDARVTDLSFQPHSARLVSVSADHSIRVWDTDRGTSVSTLHGYTNVLWCAAYLPDERIVTVGDDGVPRIWDDTMDGCQVKLGSGGDCLWAVAAEPGGEMIAAAGEDLLVRIWRLKDGLCLCTCNGHTGWIRSLDFHPRDSLLASGAEDFTVRLWNPATGTCRRTLQGHTDRVLSVSFSNDGRYLASGGEDRTVLVWDLVENEYIAKCDGHQDKVHAVDFSPDSNRVVSCGEDHQIRVWDVAQSSCLATLDGHKAKIWTVAYSPGGNIICSGGEDGVIMLWDAMSLQVIDGLRGHETRIWSLSFSPDGQRLASTSDDGTLRVWDLASRSQRRVLRPNRPYEGMRISQVEGLDTSEILVLERLGART